MDREQFRQLLLNKGEKLRNSFGWKFMNAEEKKLATDAHTFWSQQTPTTNAALDDYLLIYNGTT